MTPDISSAVAASGYKLIQRPTAVSADAAKAIDARVEALRQANRPAQAQRPQAAVSAAQTPSLLSSARAEAADQAADARSLRSLAVPDRPNSANTQHAKTAIAEQGKAVEAKTITPTSDNQGDSILQRIQDAFGAQIGGDNYSLDIDLNADGKITALDISAAIGGTQPAGNPVTLDALKGAFGSQVGDAAYNATLDLNQDGSVTAQDISALLGSQQANAPAPEPTMIDRIKQAFGKATGDAGFDAEVDLDGDGRITPLDISRALADEAERGG